MSDDAEVRSRIGKYLNEIAPRMNLPPSEKKEVLQNLEAHIHDALAKRGAANPTVADVEAVLAEMDPPESYAQGAETKPGPRSPARRLAMGCAVVIAIVLGLLVLGILARLYPGHRNGGQAGGAPRSLQSVDVKIQEGPDAKMLRLAVEAGENGSTSFALNGKPLNAEELDAALAKLAAISKTQTVLVIPGESAGAVDFDRALDRLSKHGLRNAFRRGVENRAIFLFPKENQHGSMPEPTDIPYDRFLEIVRARKVSQCEIVRGFGGRTTIRARCPLGIDGTGKPTRIVASTRHAGKDLHEILTANRVSFSVPGENPRFWQVTSSALPLVLVLMILIAPAGIIGAAVYLFIRLGKKRS